MAQPYEGIIFVAKLYSPIGAKGTPKGHTWANRKLEDHCRALISDKFPGIAVRVSVDDVEDIEPSAQGPKSSAALVFECKERIEAAYKAVQVELDRLDGMIPSTGVNVPDSPAYASCNVTEHHGDGSEVIDITQEIGNPDEPINSYSAEVGPLIPKYLNQLKLRRWGIYGDTARISNWSPEDWHQEMDFLKDNGFI